MEYGCAGDMSIRDNIIADRYFKKEYRSGFFVNRKYIDKIVDQYIKDFEIACDDKNQPVRMLSGGNIQKVVVAREFSCNPGFIIADQPTRGIDVGATEFIRKKLVELSREGAAVLLVSADLNEVMELSDSLIVMVNGKIAAYFEDTSMLNDTIMGEYMLGIKQQSDEEVRRVIHE